MRRLLPVLLLCFCHKPVDLKKESARYDDYIASLPELKPVDKNQPVRLAVRYLEADNLPTLTQAERLELYRSLEAKARELYGYSLSVNEVKPVKLGDFFASVQSRFENFPLAFPAHGFRISFFAPDREARIIESISPLWKKHDAAKIREYLGDVKDAPAAARIFLGKLGKIYAETDLRGKPLLGQENSNEEIFYAYGHWSSILVAEKEIDFFLTNTGIIGADTAMPLYVTARGGVTSALVENNGSRPYQGVGVLAVYPFLADTAYFTEQRGALTRAEKLEAILWIWLHELGHLLLKKDENYTFADSVHRAPIDLRYHEWAKRARGSANHRTAEVPAMKKF